MKTTEVNKRYYFCESGCKQKRTQELTVYTHVTGGAYATLAQHGPIWTTCWSRMNIVLAGGIHYQQGR